MPYNLRDIARSRLYEFDFGSETLSLMGADRVYQFLRREFNVYLFMEQVGNEQVQTIEYDDYTLRGRLNSRIEQYLRHNYDIRMTEYQRSELGRIIGEGMIGGEQLRYFDVVNYIRWRPGSFGESTSSCWWGGYKRGKQLFMNEMERGEAVAVRLLRPATPTEITRRGLRKWYGGYVGVGRCFVVLDNPIGVDMMINSYGLDLPQWEAFFTNVFGYEHIKRIGFGLHRATYINRGEAVAMSHEPIKLKYYRIPNFGIHTPYICKECGAKTRNENLDLRQAQLCHKCWPTIKIASSEANFYRNVMTAYTQQG